MSKRTVRVGDILIGGSDFIPIQSMTTTKTSDVEATIAQIEDLKEAGCDIIRLAIQDEDDASALKAIASAMTVPIVGDIHFDYRLAILAMENGASKIRINPGNIGGVERIKAVVACAKKYDIPIRIGVNSGSVQKEFSADFDKNESEALVASLQSNIKIFEGLDFENIVVSVKSSDVLVNTLTHRRLADLIDYPIHLGITEAGIGEMAKIKSAIGIGGLLLDGIGDTIRVSMTGDPLAEIPVAYDILRSVGKLAGAVDIISCPTCGRCRVDLPGLADMLTKKIVSIEKDRIREARLLQARGQKGLAKKTLKIAIMGCAVNGPGEARHADFGMAAGDGNAVLFRDGEIVKTAEVRLIMDELVDLVKEM